MGGLGVHDSAHNSLHKPNSCWTDGPLPHGFSSWRGQLVTQLTTLNVSDLREGLGKHGEGQSCQSESGRLHRVAISSFRTHKKGKSEHFSNYCRLISSPQHFQKEECLKDNINHGNPLPAWHRLEEGREAERGMARLCSLTTSLRMQQAVQTSCLGSAENTQQAPKALGLSGEQGSHDTREEGTGFKYLFQSRFPRVKSEFPGTQAQVHCYCHSAVSHVSPQKGEQGSLPNTPVSMDLFV